MPFLSLGAIYACSESSEKIITWKYHNHWRYNLLLCWLALWEESRFCRTRFICIQIRVIFVMHFHYPGLCYLICLWIRSSNNIYLQALYLKEFSRGHRYSIGKFYCWELLMSRISKIFEIWQAFSNSPITSTTQVYTRAMPFGKPINFFVL